ncbi:MAG TPA: class I SAM-dependent methyltransferase [Acidobacteriaceae bacterium]|nr:class I SAM-dependent methyltransferase [Acidobacteriaceae bacterium]
MEPLKERLRTTWMAGDFGKIAELSAKDAAAFVDVLDIKPGMRVLDVACGTGNLAIPAARKGAQVTGVDIAPNLLRQARHRATEEGLQIEFEEGDAEDLPFPDAEFDVVMSMFGAMFAPDPDRIASEMTRVCRHGGIVAMANWTPDGFVGKMFRLTSRFVPPPVEIPAPVLWGDAAVARLRLGSNGVDVKVRQRKILFDFPGPPHDVVEFFREYFGPTKVAFSRLDATTQNALRDDLEKLWSENNLASDGKTRIENEYLEVIGTRL